MDSAPTRNSAEFLANQVPLRPAPADNGGSDFAGYTGCSDFPGYDGSQSVRDAKVPRRSLRSICALRSLLRALRGSAANGAVHG
jgi:hypothetical protein